MKDFKMIDLLEAESVELVVDEQNKFWINIDGKCAVRVGKIKHLDIDLPETHMTHPQKDRA